MKLLIIIICLASERYLMHAASNYRENFFKFYFKFLELFKKRLQTHFNNDDNDKEFIEHESSLPYSFLNFCLSILPLLIVTWLIERFLFGIFWNIPLVIFNLIIFYLCLGPSNIFYPVVENEELNNDEIVSEKYFISANRELFAIIFWFIILGPLGILLYRTITWAINYPQTAVAAKICQDLFDWVTARVTALFYLLAGNFQRGFTYYAQMFLSSPESNSSILSGVGILAAKAENNEVSLLQSERLIEHALVIYLVLLAFLTLVAWL